MARDLGARPIGRPGGEHVTPEDHPNLITGAIRELINEAERHDRIDGHERDRLMTTVRGTPCSPDGS